MSKFSSIFSFVAHCKEGLAMFFYAVKKGRKAGVYRTWPECEKEVKGFTGAKFKKFHTEDDAWAFVNEGGAKPVISPPKPQPIIQPSASQQRKAVLLDVAPSLPHMAISSSGSQERKAERIEIVKRLDAVNKELKRLKAVSLDLQRQLDEFDNSHVGAGHSSLDLMRKRSQDQNAGGNRKKAKVSHSSGQDLFSGSDADLVGVDDPVIVYTDGSCTKNGRKGANAGIGVFWGENNPYNVAERLQGRQTNNRAEIHAVCKALSQARRMGKMSVIVKTDSQFLINSITKWIHKWKRNGWKLTDGSDVKNKEDFEKLDELQTGMTVQYEHVDAHSGIHGNEMADRLANAGARKPYIKKDSMDPDSDSDY